MSRGNKENETAHKIRRKTGREGRCFGCALGTEQGLKLIVYISRGQDSLANIWFTHM